jgi:hypothetical protein
LFHHELVVKDFRFATGWAKPWKPVFEPVNLKLYENLEK